MSLEWKVGDRIESRFEILDIKLGSMGVVYIAYDHKDARSLALKTYREDHLVLDSSLRNRFSEEARVWVSLEDIRTSFRRIGVWSSSGGRPYLLLEHIPDGDLSSWIGTPPLVEDLPQTLRLAIQVCDVSDYAFSAGLVAHGDLRPENCLVGHDGRLKVSDFGLALVDPPASSFVPLCLRVWRRPERDFGVC